MWGAVRCMDFEFSAVHAAGRFEYFYSSRIGGVGRLGPGLCGDAMAGARACAGRQTGRGRLQSYTVQPAGAAHALTAVTELAIEHFLDQHRCDTLVFGPLAGPAAGIDEILFAGRQNPELVGRADALGESCNTYFTLPTSFEDYLKGLEKKQRSNFKRMMEQSSKAHRVTFDTVAAAERTGPEFEDFCRQHEGQRLRGDLSRRGQRGSSLDHRVTATTSQLSRTHQWGKSQAQYKIL